MSHMHAFWAMTQRAAPQIQHYMSSSKVSIAESLVSYIHILHTAQRGAASLCANAHRGIFLIAYTPSPTARRRCLHMKPVSCSCARADSRRRHRTGAHVSRALCAQSRLASYIWYEFVYECICVYAIYVYMFAVSLSVWVHAREVLLRFLGCGQPEGARICKYTIVVAHLWWTLRYMHHIGPITQPNAKHNP